MSEIIMLSVLTTLIVLAVFTVREEIKYRVDK